MVSVLLAPFRGIDVGREIAERAGRLRRESGIRLPDTLIAATAVEQKLSLFTRNRSDLRESAVYEFVRSAEFTRAPEPGAAGREPSRVADLLGSSGVAAIRSNHRSNPAGTRRSCRRARPVFCWHRPSWSPLRSGGYQCPENRFIDNRS